MGFHRRYLSNRSLSRDFIKSRGVFREPNFEVFSWKRSDWIKVPLESFSLSTNHVIQHLLGNSSFYLPKCKFLKFVKAWSHMSLSHWKKTTIKHLSIIEIFLHLRVKKYKKSLPRRWFYWWHDGSTSKTYRLSSVPIIAFWLNAFQTYLPNSQLLLTVISSFSNQISAFFHLLIDVQSQSALALLL